MFKINNKRHQSHVIDGVLLFLLLTLNIFHTFSSVPIAEFEQVNVSWVLLSGKSVSETRYPKNISF